MPSGNDFFYLCDPRNKCSLMIKIKWKEIKLKKQDSLRGTPRTRAPAPAKPTQASQACSSRRRHPPADPPLASSSIERSPPKAQSLFLSPSTPPRLFLSLFLRGSPPLHTPPQIYPFQRKEEVFPRPTRKARKPHRPRTGNSTPAAFPLRSLRLFHASVSHDPIQV